MSYYTPSIESILESVENQISNLDRRTPGYIDHNISQRSGNIRNTNGNNDSNSIMTNRSSGFRSIISGYFMNRTNNNSNNNYNNSSIFNNLDNEINGNYNDNDNNLIEAINNSFQDIEYQYEGRKLNNNDSSVLDKIYRKSLYW